MSFTFQNIADRARLPLNDAAKTRYPDSELLGYGVDAYLLLRRHRPDLFLTAYSAPTAWNSLTLGSTFPGSVGDEYMPALADYVAARAEFKDDEHAVSGRAKEFYALFASGVRG